VSLEAKVNVTEDTLPEEVCAEAVKVKIVPSWTEVLVPGVRFTLAG
jgi:hypothetical protein